MLKAPAKADTGSAVTTTRSFLGLPRPFVIFLGGLAVSKLGDALYLFALPWIAYELTRSPLVMGTLYATEILPILIFGALTGVFVDRWYRRRLMLVADLSRGLIVASLPLLQLAGWLQLWYLYLAAFALALVSLAFDVTTTAVIPQLAGSDLTKANAAHQLVMQLGAMAGPALAGIVIAAFGGFNALWLDALSFAGTFLAVLLLPPFEKVATNGPANVSIVLKGMGKAFAGCGVTQLSEC